VERRKIDTTQHFTEPPPRYSEASLVKRMEELGIGRPSTYASILQVLKDRDYVVLDKKKLVPQDKGRLVTAFLESFFGRYVEYDFTAGLEEDLDRVSNSELEWKAVLRAFWNDFSGNVDGIKDLRVGQVLEALDTTLAPHLFPQKTEGVDPRACPSCGDGRLSLKLGKFGAFIGCSNYPGCKFTRPFAVPGDGDGKAAEDTGTKVLGVDPASQQEVTIRDGRFGVYIQLGEGEEGEKPKRSSLPPGMARDAVDLDIALQLLSLPREIARHPESGKPILAGIGRYGPYVQHEKTYANLGRDDDVLSIGGNRAIDLIVAKETGARRPRGGAADPGKVIGVHPVKGGDIVARAGRFGPYVAHNGINATLPRGKTGESITLDEAVALIEARIEKGAVAKPARGGRTAGKPKPSKGLESTAKAAAKAPKAAAKKTAAKAPAKEPAAKKAAAKKKAK
jgi:DNA topoisomerase-1